MTVPTVTALLQDFFTERLVRQLQARPQTVSAYRDTIKLLLMFAAQKTTKTPSRLTIDDLDAVIVGAFLSYLDNERHNSTGDPQRAPGRDPLLLPLCAAADP